SGDRQEPPGAPVPPERGAGRRARSLRPGLAPGKEFSISAADRPASPRGGVGEAEEAYSLRSGLAGARSSPAAGTPTEGREPHRTGRAEPTAAGGGDRTAPVDPFDPAGRLPLPGRSSVGGCRDR